MWSTLILQKGWKRLRKNILLTEPTHFIFSFLSMFERQTFESRAWPLHLQITSKREAAFSLMEISNKPFNNNNSKAVFRIAGLKKKEPDCCCCRICWGLWWKTTVDGLSAHPPGGGGEQKRKCQLSESMLTTEFAAFMSQSCAACSVKHIQPLTFPNICIKKGWEDWLLREVFTRMQPLIAWA